MSNIDEIDRIIELIKASDLLLVIQLCKGVGITGEEVVKRMIELNFFILDEHWLSNMYKVAIVDLIDNGEDGQYYHFWSNDLINYEIWPCMYNK